MVLLVCFGNSLCVRAQSSIVFVPSTDVQGKKSFYLNLESYAHFDKYVNRGFQSYGTSITYGAAKNIEAGINVYFTEDQSGIAAELQPNVKWQIFESGKKVLPSQSGSFCLYR